MNIFHIAFSNLKRRKIKMLFLMMGIIVGLATVVATQSIIQGMNLDLGNRIDELGANAVIVPRAEGIEAHFGGTMSSNLAFDVQKLTLEDVPKIYSSSVGEYINIVSPKLVGAVKIGERNSLIVGIEPKNEFAQKPWISLNQQYGVTQGERLVDLALIEMPMDGIIIGMSASEALNLQIGDEVLIEGQSFTVFGILNKIGSEEDGLIYAQLNTVQELLKRPQELSMIDISAYCNECPIEEIVMGLEEAIPNGRVISVRQAALFREEMISQFTTFGYALSGIVILIAALVILATMLSSVNERTREIGILRSIGFRKFHIIMILFIEVGIVSLIGSGIGFSLGGILAYYAGPYIAQIAVQMPLQFSWFLPAVLISTALSILVTAYPAIRAASLDPAEALRFI